MINNKNKETIVLLGDSLFNYFNTSKYFNNTNIINKGIPGDTTKGVISRLDEIYQIKPKIVLLNIGTNDLAKYDNDKLEEIVRRILFIKYELETNIKDVKVHILSLSPVLRNHKITNNAYMHNRTNESIRKINEELTIYTNIICVNGCLSDDESGSLKLTYTTDGLHFTNEGYKIFAKHLAKNVKELSLINKL